MESDPSHIPVRCCTELGFCNVDLGGELNDACDSDPDHCVSTAMQTAAQENGYVGNSASSYYTTPPEPESVRGKVCALSQLVMTDRHGPCTLQDCASTVCARWFWTLSGAGMHFSGAPVCCGHITGCLQACRQAGCTFGTHPCMVQIKLKVSTAVWCQILNPRLISRVLLAMHACKC